MAPETEWPASRRYRKSPPGNVLEEDLDALGSVAEMRAGIAFQGTVQFLLRAYHTSIEPALALPELLTLIGRVEHGRGENQEGLLLALACLELIRTEPSVKAWTYLWSLTWHSAQLGHDLSRTAVFLAKRDITFKNQLLRLATGLIEYAVENPSLRSFTREASHFPDLQEYWKHNPALIKIWWNLREGRSVEFRADQGAFGIVAALDLNLFMEHLQCFDNPYPIQSALLEAGAALSFSTWKSLLSIAPLAFDSERRWTGSVIAPLLLVIARDQVLEARASIRSETPDANAKSITSEIDALAKEVAEVLASRVDAGPCAERWATWLMRQSLSGLFNEAIPFPVDARSGGYTDASLVTAIGKRLSNHAWGSSAAPDAEPWESWSYRCVLVTLAASGFTTMPSAESFIEQWQVDPDDWASKRGYLLRERASLFETFGNRADAYGTRLLSIPLVEAPFPHAIWMELWRATQTIREVIEYGDSEATLNLGESTQLSAGRLMRLVFGLGLMMLDSIVDRERNISSDRQTTFENLFASLASVVNELALIDRFDQHYWSDAFRHLAIRRAIWSKDVGATTAVTFEPTSKPTFADFVSTLSADTENLFALIEVALRNKVAPQAIKRALDEKGIDLLGQIAFAERIMDLSPKRAGVSATQLSAVRTLLVPQPSTVISS